VAVPPESTRDDEPGYADRLKASVAGADLRVLLMVLFQTTGDEKWFGFHPKRDVKLIADEDAGLSAAEQDAIKAAAFEILLRNRGREPVIKDPSDALMKRMMDACLGESVPPEYAPLMREELGFVSRDVQWNTYPRTEPRPVLIVGAGVSGIALGARLQRLGLPYIILERHADVGGVWLENTYPGAGVDTPNHSYSYSFGTPYRWSRYFSTRDEIHDYLRRSAEDFNVRPNIRFDSEVQAAEWSASAHHWVVTVKTGDRSYQIQSKALVSAIGQFGAPSVPIIPGVESFSGPMFHSSRWPAGLDVRGKRVAVIGTGASAMQIVPTIVDQVESVTVYQRTPQWIRPIARYHDEIGTVQWLLDNVPLYAAWFRFTMWWRYGDGLLPLLRKDPDWAHPDRSLNQRNDRHRIEMVEHIRKELGDRADLFEKCVPSYPPFGKRILLDNGWYRAITKPQAELVVDGVTKITPGGVLAADGRERLADLIIFATGFDVSAMASRLNIKGCGGRSLAEEWDADNPRAYLGISVPGFPNFFMMAGPNTGLGHGGSSIFQAESQARYITGMLVRMLEAGVSSVDVRRDVFERFVDRVDREHEQLVWTHPGVSTYYRNTHGRVVSVMPFRLVDYWSMTRDPTLADYHVETGPA
jgi:4-hydroxyacetophenone monooxygenase